jgi:polyisoprenoid-binding protein YceI
MATATLTRSPIASGTWSIDAAHSKIGFSVKHLGVSTVRGEFNEFEGTLEVGEDLASAKVRGSVRAGSVDTNEPQRDEHLRSPDFFDADTHPEIRFESKSIEPVDQDSFRIVGDLTLHGVTREIELEAEITGAGQDLHGNERVGLEVTGSLSRGAYGMKFNQALGGGNVLVSDKVQLVLDIAAVRNS